jgi:hypothetical protein
VQWVFFARDPISPVKSARKLPGSARVAWIDAGHALWTDEELAGVADVIVEFAHEIAPAGR